MRVGKTQRGANDIPPTRPYRCRARCSKARCCTTDPCAKLAVRGHGARVRGRVRTARCDRIAVQQKCDAVRPVLSSPRSVQRGAPLDRGPSCSELIAAALLRAPRPVAVPRNARDGGRTSEFPRRARRSTRCSSEADPIGFSCGSSLAAPREGTIRAACGSPGCGRVGT